MDNAFEHYSNVDLHVSENTLHRYFLHQPIRQEGQLWMGGGATLHVQSVTSSRIQTPSGLMVLCSEMGRTFSAASGLFGSRVSVSAPQLILAQQFSERRFL